MRIKGDSIEQIKNIPTYTRRHCDETPILAETVDPKCLCYDGREDAEEGTVGQPRSG